MLDAFGFVTGAICVWLTVKENVWNWPVGLVNNIVFFVMFSQARLFADAGLQIVYLVLGVYGWWNWIHGGTNRSELPIRKTTRNEWIVIAIVAPLATLALREILIAAQGAAPFWDSVTTVLSLVAQTMLTRKQLEHWFVWMLADVIYVPLYITRKLPLTGLLYALFLVLCVAGVMEWLGRWRRTAAIA